MRRGSVVPVRASWVTWLVVLALVVLGGCVGGCIDLQPEARMCVSDLAVAPAPRPVTYHADVAPIAAAKCMRCHTPGGPGPFALLTYGDFVGMKARIRGALVSRTMPPWPPADCCSTYRHALALTDDELGVFVGWIDAGTPEGTPPAVAPPVQRAGLDRVDTVLEMPYTYLPGPPEGETDETRCFILDWPATEPRYVTGIDIQPGDGPQVHHSLVLTASPEDAAHLQEIDDETEAPGFPCPGGIVSRFKGFLGGGFFQAQVYEDGIGHEVLPGDKVILTMHYSVPKRGAFMPDRTKILLRHQAEPTKRIVALSVYNPSWLLGAMKIPEGEKEVTFSYVDDPVKLNGDRPFLLHAVNLHMHERGARGQIAILRDNGDRECLLQVDAWNHDWQGDFTFDVPKRLEKGDRLLVSCTFDNSPAHQRLRGGKPESPRDLNWAEDEEMCIGFVTATQAE